MKKAYVQALALGHAPARAHLESIYSKLGDKSRLHGQCLFAETLLSLSKPAEAFQSIRRDLQKYPDAQHLWDLLSRWLISIRFRSSVKNEVLDDLEKALSVEGINHQFMVVAIVSALRFEPELTPLLSLEGDAEQLFTTANQRVCNGELLTVAGNAVFCKLLQTTIINEVSLENRLTALRRAFLHFIVSPDIKIAGMVEKYMPLLGSLAQQCFLNEYIYVLDKSEAHTIDGLLARLQHRLDSGSVVPPQWLAIIAAYRPLYVLTCARQLHDMTSLSYAIRKARSAGLRNIEFMQADILELAGIDREYDHINCFGVLQLLEDTEKGLDILKNRLVQVGTMLIALYSTLGRRAVAQTREYIRQQAYQADAEDMRQYRQDLVAMKDRDYAGAIINSLTFYNMSNFRDLVFHSTEKTFTLLELKEILDKLDLELLGFEISDPVVRTRYRQRYPQDTDMTSLHNWHEFEVEFPDTFANCHAFWLRS